MVGNGVHTSSGTGIGLLTDAVFHSAVEGLLARAGCAGPFNTVQLAGGANNQVFRVDRDAGEPLLLKVYFRHPDDPRDRLGTEFGFLSFIWSRGVHAVPRPLAADPECGIALYEYIVGKPFVTGEIRTEHVDAALKLFRDINELRGDPKAPTLPNGSEACFSAAGHLHLVEKRLTRLESISAESPVDREAASFVALELQSAWRSVREHVRESADRCGIDIHDELSRAERCLSPSDFGFHNALEETDGSLRFIDFEYAGWDDPARTVADFFCQPKVPVPREFFQHVVHQTVLDGTDTERHALRCSLLLPIYRVKWCTILLNQFLPVGRDRRGFAAVDPEDTERKELQLEKARATLKLVEKDIKSRIANVVRTDDRPENSKQSKTKVTGQGRNE